MRALHALALLICALAPPLWILLVVGLILTHGDSIGGWSADDWGALAALVVGLPLLAAVLLRVPGAAQHRRTQVLR